jgi:hypothetical protein
MLSPFNRRATNVASTKIGVALGLGFGRAKKVAASGLNLTSKFINGNAQNKLSQGQQDQADPTLKGRLPKGWEERESSTAPGTFYYVNVRTGESTWDIPTATASDGSDEVCICVANIYASIRLTVLL